MMFWKYALLFLTDGILGYLLQVTGYLLGLYAAVKQNIVIGKFFLMSVIFAIVGFGIRQISVISFGFHSILIMIAFIFIAVLIMKTPIFMTVLGILIPSIAVLISEVINMALLSVFIGYDMVLVILAGDGTVDGEIFKAIAGIPMNLILVSLMFIFYKVRMKQTKEQKTDGETCAVDGKENWKRIER